MTTTSRSPIFVTLGPEGTNHHTMVQAYAKFRDLPNVDTRFVDDFREALEMVEGRKADFILVCGVHPQCSTVVGEGRFRHGIHLMDTFISPTQPLGILTRKGIDNPRTLALQPATAGYTDISDWTEQVHVSSIMRIAEGLLKGEYDSGLTALRVADEHPDLLRVDREIGSPDDPWLVLGRHRVSGGGIVAWKDSPAAKIITSTCETNSKKASL